MRASRMPLQCAAPNGSAPSTRGPDWLDTPYRHIVAGMGRTHYFPTDEVHFTWDTGNAPVITIADGDTVVFETRDVSDNQIGPDSDTSVVAGLDWDRVYP